MPIRVLISRTPAALEHAEALVVFALPTGAFNLDPGLAWAPDVGTVEALGHDALEPEFGAMLEQELAVGERLDLAHEGHAPRTAQPAEVPLALGKGQGPEVHAIVVQQVERHDNQVRLAGPPRTHLLVQFAEIGLSRGVG
jgi:hypothetical protein